MARGKPCNDAAAIARVPVATSGGRLVPLGELARIDTEPAAAHISRENIHRRITVSVNVRGGGDIASFVQDAMQAVERVRLPPGYTLAWGGTFENLERASQRLVVVVPLALLLIFVLLFVTFGSARPAILIFLNVPFAATGGVLALALRGMPFSISAAVGFIALFGIAVMNGVVLLSYVTRLQKERALSADDAAREGAIARMRPVITTALVAALGFVPMALARGAGAEVRRPLATVVIGGLITSTLLTLFVLPARYGFVERLGTMTTRFTAPETSEAPRRGATGRG